MLGALFLAILGACSTTQEATPAATPVPDQGTVLNVLLGTLDLAVGGNRLMFALLDAEGEPIKQDSVVLSFAYQDGAEATTGGEVTAVLRVLLDFLVLIILAVASRLVRTLPVQEVGVGRRGHYQAYCVRRQVLGDMPGVVLNCGLGAHSGPYAIIEKRLLP